MDKKRNVSNKQTPIQRHKESMRKSVFDSSGNPLPYKPIKGKTGEKINIVTVGQNGHRKIEKANVIEYLDDGLVLVAGLTEGQRYSITDPYSGLALVSGRSQKAVNKALNEKFMGGYTPLQHYKNVIRESRGTLLKVNTLGKNGKWKPINANFSHMIMVKASKPIGDKNADWHPEGIQYKAFVSPKQRDEALKKSVLGGRFLKSSPNTIQKVYGTEDDNPLSVTEYMKGRTPGKIERATWYKEGVRSPKGVKLLSKKFFK